MAFYYSISNPVFKWSISLDPSKHKKVIKIFFFSIKWSRLVDHSKTSPVFEWHSITGPNGFRTHNNHTKSGLDLFPNGHCIIIYYSFYITVKLFYYIYKMVQLFAKSDYSMPGKS
jgi:hypothetical protein